MKFRLSKIKTTLIFSVLCTSVSHASIINQGSLSMDIGDTNGNLNEVFFNSNPYYDLGFSASDWGLQLGTNTSTFTISTNRSSSNPFGFSSVSIGATGSSATGGSYTTSGANISVERNYDFVSGFNAFTTTTSLTNLGTSEVALRLFETYDPDQGPGSATTNDIVDILGSTVAVSSNGGISSAVGDLFPPSLTGFSGGFGLSIASGIELNDFMNGSGVDPDNAFDDIGFSLGWDINLSAGESIDISSLHCYGVSAEDVSSCFNGVRVPEPSSLALFGIGILGVGVWCRRKVQARA